MKPRRSRDTECWGILPDIHAPYHNKRSLRVALNVLDHLEVDGVVQMGDLIDNYACSSHTIDPRVAVPLTVEIAAARKVREQIEAATKGAKRIITEGNHETRLERYVLKNAPRLLGIVPEIQDLLGFAEPAWKWHPYGSFTKIGRLNLTHCVNGRAGAQEHMRARADFEGDVLIGHTHRSAIGFVGTAQGKTRTAAMIGCLIDINQKAATYLAKIQARRYWQQGLARVYLERGSGTPHVLPITIMDGRACVDGKIIRA